jgi:hypothetical protein
VIVWVPTAKAAVEKVTLPAVKVPVPRVVVPPSRKVTVPVGVPGDELVTVAVKVTLWPKSDGFSDEVSVVVVAGEFTVWVKTADVLVWKLTSPL